MSDLRAALVAIQELHKPVEYRGFSIPYPVPEIICNLCVTDVDGPVAYPCATRRLADDALTARTTKNGEKP